MGSKAAEWYEVKAMEAEVRTIELEMLGRQLAAIRRQISEKQWRRCRQAKQAGIR
jgi:hypothetical protein